MDQLHKTFNIIQTKAVENQPNTFDIVISTGEPDRDGDIIEVAGWDFTNYLNNPVVIYVHNYRDVPIGKTLALRKENDQVIARFQWRDPANEFDPILPIRAAWDQDMLRGASVGAIPIEWEPITDGIDPNDRWALMFAPRRYTKTELLEWSICPLPANANALRMAIKALDESARHLEKPLTLNAGGIEVVKRQPEAAQEPTAELTEPEPTPAAESDPLPAGDPIVQPVEEEPPSEPDDPNINELTPQDEEVLAEALEEALLAVVEFILDED
jgi:hypothetical protein